MDDEIPPNLTFEKHLEREMSESATSSSKKYVCVIFHCSSGHTFDKHVNVYIIDVDIRRRVNMANQANLKTKLKIPHERDPTNHQNHVKMTKMTVTVTTTTTTRTATKTIPHMNLMQIMNRVMKIMLQHTEIKQIHLNTIHRHRKELI